MVELATGEPVPPASYPPLATQAGNAIGSMARFVASGFAVATAEEQARRLAICHLCPEYDAIRVRCRKCGCRVRLKARIASDRCPLSKW
jgi:hypothetical protein